jgi:antirestriction protein ArdC
MTSGTDKIYTMVTDALIASLEADIVPWMKPWAETGSPQNAITKRNYTGINRILLQSSKFVDPRWLSYKQAAAKGGNVRKGEASTIITFWKRAIKHDKQTCPGRKACEAMEKGANCKRFGMLRYYRVFNVEQCDGLNLEPLTVEIPNPVAIHEAAQTVLDEYLEREDGLTLQHGCDGGCGGAGGAHYIPSLDIIHLPKRDTFKTVEGYYSTAFHEAGHSTGKPGRECERKDWTGEYTIHSGGRSREELVAEFTSAFVSEATGLDNTLEHDQHAAYVKSWLGHLKNNPKWAVEAAGYAQKAANRILGINV